MIQVDKKASHLLQIYSSFNAYNKYYIELQSSTIMLYALARLMRLNSVRLPLECSIHFPTMVLVNKI